MFGFHDVYIFSSIFIGCGVFSFAFGLREYLRWRSLLRNGVKTRGIARVLADDDDCVSLTATFADEGGKTYRIISKGGNSGWTALDGQEIDILYERGKPKEARMVVDLELRTGLSIYMFGMLFIGIGAVALVLHLFGIEIMTE
ncbi:MAG TPA: hypothetical protein PKN50_04765 [Spirochaetota bacterium]|nr:hypothetical protein [Spirochaetota bacterium]HPV39809.1 hypothetical protein [Spirochaetota bacterium]